MVECKGCGANLAPDAARCPYCGVVTAHGVRVEQERARIEQERAREHQAREARRAHAERSAAEVQVKRAGNIAAFFSVLGLGCCAPASLAAIGMALRARSLANRHGLPVPLTASASLVLGVVGVVVFAVLIALYRADVAEVEARIAALEARVATTAAAPTLDEATACTLVEVHLLHVGYDGTTPTSIDAVECAGRVEQAGDHARLTNVRIARAVAKEATATACFSRGARWVVVDVGDAPACAGSVVPQPAAPEAPPLPDK